MLNVKGNGGAVSLDLLIYHIFFFENIVIKLTVLTSIPYRAEINRKFGKSNLPDEI